MGTDLVHVPRIQKVLARHGQRFAERVLAPEELLRWQTHADPAAYLAKRWAVKEAAAKALGTGIGGDTGFHDLRVARSAAGKPLLLVTGRAEATARALGIEHWHVSISDEGDYALAFVVAEGRTGAA
ncbi:holo-ACP synthase [Aquisalimonas sp.]|uniref:holo-ACP synthase n=1 Tax=Aquisalimonas sp. TaxID=1872621 RepID=UPI0025B9A11C|nr:holo-ACP synthase [Aquisalimonas sp.]